MGGVAARIDRVVRGQFTARRRAAFLAALAESGNVRLAAEAAGTSSTRVYHERRRDAGFAADWAAALDAAEAALDGSRGDRGELVVRRNCRGRLQRRVARVNDWTEANDARFLAALIAGGNITAAAAETGKHVSRVYARRRASAGFRAAMDEALEEAEVRLEWLLMEHAAEALQPAAGAAGGKAPDPAVAISILKYRAAQRAGTRRRGGRPRGEPAIEAVRDEVRAKLAAIRRHRGG